MSWFKVSNMKNVFCLVLLLTFSTGLIAQINDNCINATLLNVEASCVYSAFSSIGATAEGTDIAGNPGCGFYQGGDVWFKVVMPISGAIRLEIERISGSIPQYAIYSGSCGNFERLVCAQLDAHKTVVRPALANDTLFVRVFGYNTTDGGEFNLCLWEPIVPPNDLCDNAIALAVSDSCMSSAYSCRYAASIEPYNIPGPGCGFYKGGDIWFTAVVPASGAMRIDVDQISGTVQTAIFSGACDSLTRILCNQLNNEKTFLIPELAGETIYVRAFGYNTEEGGDFSICLFEVDIAPNNHCADAIPIIMGDSCDFTYFSNQYATAESTSVAPNPGCGFYKGGDVWFTTVVPASGEMRIEVDQLGATIQTALYTGSCGNFTPVLCNQLNNQKTFVLPDAGGDTLYIRAFRYNSEEGGEFGICIYEVDIAPNDNCADAIPLLLDDTCIAATFSNEFATADSSSVGPNPGCGFYKGGDVWFRVHMPSTGEVRIMRQNIQGVNAQMALYSGACGDLTRLTCAQLNSSINYIDTSLANEDLYLRVFNYNNEEGGLFNLCSYNPNCITQHVDLGMTTICEGEQLSFGDQILTESGIFMDTLRNRDGCDSILTVELLVQLNSETILDTNACAGQYFLFPDGSNWQLDQDTMQSSVLTNSVGCDSLVISHISVIPIDAGVSLSDQTLTANMQGVSYQWVDCANGFEWISNAVDSVYTIDVSGTFAVIVENQGCVDTSDCQVVSVVGVDNKTTADFALYPNPAQDYLYLKTARTVSQIQLRTITGQLMNVPHNAHSDRTKLDIRGLEKGVYILSFTQADQRISTYFIRH